MSRPNPNINRKRRSGEDVPVEDSSDENELDGTFADDEDDENEIFSILPPLPPLAPPTQQPSPPPHVQPNVVETVMHDNSDVIETVIQDNSNVDETISAGKPPTNDVPSNEGEKKMNKEKNMNVLYIACMYIKYFIGFCLFVFTFLFFYRRHRRSNTIDKPTTT